MDLEALRQQYEKLKLQQGLNNDLVKRPVTPEDVAAYAASGREYASELMRHEQPELSNQVRAEYLAKQNALRQLMGK